MCMTGMHEGGGGVFNMQVIRGNCAITARGHDDREIERQIEKREKKLWQFGFFLVRVSEKEVRKKG